MVKQRTAAGPHKITIEVNKPLTYSTDTTTEICNHMYPTDCHAVVLRS